MKRIQLIFLLCTLFFATSCEIEEGEKEVHATMLLQFQMPTVLTKNCFKGENTLTKTFIRQRTKDDFLLGHLLHMDDKILTKVFVTNVALKYAAHSDNIARFINITLRTEGLTNQQFYEKIEANKEIVAGANIFGAFEYAFNEALVKNNEVILGVLAEGCSLSSLQIDGWFQVDIKYDVNYMDM